MIDARYVAMARKWAAAWSKAYGVVLPVDLVLAVISVESGGNPNARLHEANGQWSRGLMQVQEPTAAQMGYRNANLNDPDVGIEVGTKYLAWQVRRYQGNLRHAVPAYNAGTMKKRSDGRYINQGYVDKVFSRYQGSIPAPAGLASVALALILAASVVIARIKR